MPILPNRAIASVMLHLLAFASSANADSLTARVTDYGIFSRGTERLTAHPSSPSGVSRSSQGEQLLQQTRDVPLQIGTKFGFCFEVVGFENDGMVKFEREVTHPTLRRPDGTVGSSYRVVEPVQVIARRAYTCLGYSFDHAFELLPGTWRFAVSIANQPLVVQEFFVQ